MQLFDMEQLRTFVAVTEAGSLTRAAPAVFLSQSAVSEQMRKLEALVGQPLLVRSKTGVVATPAGQRLIAHARRMLALGDEALRELRGESLHGELRLAVTDYFRPGDLTQLLARLGQGYPQVRLHVSVQKSGVIESAYARGDFDVGLSMRIEGRSPGQSAAGARAGQMLRRESLAWIGAAGMRIDRAEPLRLVLLPDSCSLHQCVVKLLRSRGAAFTVAHEASGVAGLQSALAAGLGVGCLNESGLVEGLVRLTPAHRLPALPRVAFHFLPPRRGETDFVTRARALLASHLV